MSKIEAVSPSATEQKLRGKIAECFKVARKEGILIHLEDDVLSDTDTVISFIKSSLPELAKEAGWVKLKEDKIAVACDKAIHYNQYTKDFIDGWRSAWNYAEKQNWRKTEDDK